jgi:hypothetical protein
VTDADGQCCLDPITREELAEVIENETPTNGTPNNHNEVPQASVGGAFGELDLDRLVAGYPLVVEAVVIGQESGVQRVESRLEPYDIPYTMYNLEVARSWNGVAPETMDITVPSGSRVELERGVRYLLFLEEEPMPEDAIWGGHRYLSDPQRVWTVEEGSFRPWPGIPHFSAMTHEELAQVIAVASE